MAAFLKPPSVAPSIYPSCAICARGVDKWRCTAKTVFSSLKYQVVSLQTAHSWANAGVLLGDACIGSGVAFEAITLLG